MTDQTTPAFPQPTGINLSYSGMTLRDYFAARAMESLVQHFLLEKLHLHDNDWMAGVAMDAYSMADAMLKERQK